MPLCHDLAKQFEIRLEVVRSSHVVMPQGSGSGGIDAPLARQHSLQARPGSQQLANCCIRQTQCRPRFIVELVEVYVAMRIQLVRSQGKVEEAAIVHQPDPLCIAIVFPRPIDRCELAKCRITKRNVVARIVSIQSQIEFRCCRPHLNRQEGVV
ncbi:hypothetical protein WK60_03695 [Burkholderia ubonensis]|nr:hypothetical protein WK60_03695 [Burkholderia ubonensis]